MSLFRILATVLFVLAVPVALVTSNIRFVANEDRVYRYAIDEYNAPATTGIARDELLRASSEIQTYFNNDAEVLDIRVHENGREVSLFNERETAHMADVKDRFELVNRAQEFSVLFIISYIAVVALWAREVSLRAVAMQVAAGSAICVVVIGAIGAVGAAGFEGAWEDFHKLMFSNDFWLLNPSTDHLIQIFPPAFWERIVFFIGTLIAAEAILLIVGALIYVGASRYQTSQRLRVEYAT